MDSSGLASVEREWLKLFHELRGHLGPVRDQIAPLFLSVRPVGYDPLARASVLYVGKATNGRWNPECDPRALTLEDTRAYTRLFISKEAETYNSPFWRFARELSKRVAAANGRGIRPFQNLVWTNLCKIGVVKRSPQKRIVLAQSNLAVKTLRSEIEAYRPKLIVFMTGDFGDGTIAQLVGDPEWKSWHKSRQRQLGWWRKPIGQVPAIFWADHPQGKPLALREAWLKQVEQLLAQ